jgi:hypothetical protein
MKKLITLSLSIIGLAIFLIACASTEKISKNNVVENNENYIQYNVVKGDCLWDISGKKDIYNDNFMWPLIYRENVDDISDPDIIEINQKLKIKIKNSVSEIDKNEAIKIAQEYTGE